MYQMRLLPIRRYDLEVVILVALSVTCSHGTTVIVVVASNGIVLASDSKQTTASHVANPKPAIKAHVINDRVAVAVVGAADLEIFADSKTVFSYHTVEFLQGIKDSSPADASVSAVVAIIRDKSHTAMNGLTPYMANGFFDEKKAPAGNLIDYIVVGYEQGVPSVVRISIKPDWEARKLSAPVIKTIHPSQDTPPSGADIRFYGVTQAIQNAALPGSTEQGAALARYPGVIRGLEVRRNGLIIDASEAAVVAADLIRLQAEFDSNDVGLPVNLLTVFDGKRPTVISISK